MKNDLSLSLQVQSSLGYSYSTSNNEVVDVNNIRFWLALTAGKQTVGETSLNWKEILNTSFKDHKKESFDKEILIKVYETMVKDLNQEILKLKT